MRILRQSVTNLEKQRLLVAADAILIDASVVKLADYTSSALAAKERHFEQGEE
jgi:hypothetical protein